MVFGSTGFNVRIHRQEDYYGEYYPINEDRLTARTSYAELLGTSSASFDRLVEIMEKPQAKLLVASRRFAALKRYPSSLPK